MKPIAVNELGSINITEDLIEKIVLLEMQKCSKIIIPCNKNGKLLTKADIKKAKDSFGAVNVSIDDDIIILEVNYIAVFGKSIKNSAEILFRNITDVFNLIGLAPRIEIIANIKGIMSDRIADREIKILWKNNKAEVI